jgi:hypothetical protein
MKRSTKLGIVSLTGINGSRHCLLVNRMFENQRIKSYARGVHGLFGQSLSGGDCERDLF